MSASCSYSIQCTCNLFYSFVVGKVKLVSHQMFIRINNEENDPRDALSRRHLIGFARKHQFHRSQNISKSLYCLSNDLPYQPIA